MTLDPAIYALIFLGVVAVLFFGFLLRKQIRFLFQIVLNSAIGALLLILLNTVGAPIGLSMGVNAVTALTVGVLGIPGLLALYVLKFLLK